MSNKHSTPERKSQRMVLHGEKRSVDSDDEVQEILFVGLFSVFAQVTSHSRSQKHQVRGPKYQTVNEVLTEVLLL